MDLYGQLHAINHTPERIARRQASRARRAELHSLIGPALGTSRGAQLTWALEQQDPLDNPGAPIGRQHPGTAAILAVRNALAEYKLPMNYTARVTGTKRYTGHGAHAIEEGEIFVEVTLRSLSGVNRVVDVPVMIRAGRIEEPVILIDRGEYRTITQNTLDDLVGRGTFYTSPPTRTTMYSPPPDQIPQAKSIPIVRPGLFGFGQPNRMLTAAYVRSAMTGHYVADLPSYQAAAWSPTMSENHLDIGEQEPPKITAGEEVTLKRAVDTIDRGGQRWHLTRGSSGVVQRDHAGDGRAFYVYFPDECFTALIPGDALR